MSNTRFSVGEKYLFIRVFYENGENRPWTPAYCPWVDKDPEIFVTELECVEHHEVPNAHDPQEEKTCDGFIFKDANGNVWYNQYPTAHYGQISTDNDYLVRPHNHEGHPKLQDFLNDSLEQATVFLDRINRGITKFLSESVNPENTEEDKAANKVAYDSMVAYEKTLTKLLEETWKVKVTREPIETKRNDGSVERFFDIKRTVLTSIV